MGKKMWEEKVETTRDKKKRVMVGMVAVSIT